MTTKPIYNAKASMSIRIVMFMLAFAFASAASAAPSARLDSLLRLIDEAINKSETYVVARQHTIDSLRNQLARARKSTERYDLSYRLYEAYLPFNNDSALAYLQRSATIATAMGNASKAGGCRALMALGCSNAGMYIEAREILNAIDRQKLHGTDLGLYYFAFAHVSGELAYYSKLPEMAAHYAKDADTYRSEMMKYLPQNHRYMWQCREMIDYNSGRLKQSLAINTAWLKTVQKGSTEYALITYFRYLEYKKQGDSIQAVEWLAESVLSDIRNAVMDQGSMWEMSNTLIGQGDVNRSYRYICFTSDCAERFGSRQRLMRISPLLTRIAQSYKSKMESSNRSLQFTISAISALTVLLALSLLFLYRQRRRLEKTRDQLARSNGDLQESNASLSALNRQQTELNNQLHTLNQQLAEANTVKEEYVGRFISLCSMYINKLDTLRKTVNKKIKAKQYSELLELTHSNDFVEQNINELYANFDSAFLHLFPTFVDDFNALLRPESRIVLSENNKLNTTMRIFALIRLGITDSSKIADFLHYSVNTIYNYRAHTKNCALVDRAQFENRVKNIGLPTNE